MNAGSDGGLGGAARRTGSVVRTFRAVAWSFFGVRRSSDLERDLSELNPIHVVIAAVVAAALFIAGLVGLVSWVIRSGVAA